MRSGANYRVVLRPRLKEIYREGLEVHKGKRSKALRKARTKKNRKVGLPEWHLLKSLFY